MNIWMDWQDYCIWYVVLILEIYNSSSSSNILEDIFLEKGKFVTQYLTF